MSIGLTVLNIHRGFDTGGQGNRITDAFRRLEPEWTHRSMYVPNTFTYLDYPVDTEWDASEAKRLYAAADVVHLHNGFRTARLFEKRGPTKPAVVHYHGTQFRQNPSGPLVEQVRRGAVGIVSTLDLWLMAPELTEWLPSPYNLDALLRLRA